MRIAIAGSTGLIGTTLVDHLTAAGHTVRRLVRRPPHDDEIEWDPRGGTVDRGALSEVDAVVNLAGEPIQAGRWTERQKEKIRASRVEGTGLLASALAEIDGPSVLVNGSAIGYYGDRGDEPLEESSPPGDGFMADVCRQWEAATAPAADAGVRVVSIRSAVVLDPSGGALRKQLPLFRLGLGGRLSSGRQWFSWISIVDQVGAILHLLEHDVHGPVNLSSPNPVTNAEFTATLASVLRRPAVLPVPRFALRLVFGEMIEDLLASIRVQPVKLAESGYRFRQPDLEGALRDLLDR